MLTKPGNLEVGNAETGTALKILVSPPCKQACCENQDYISYMPCLVRQGQGLEEAHHCLRHDAHTCTHGTTCTYAHTPPVYTHDLCAYAACPRAHLCICMMCTPYMHMPVSCMHIASHKHVCTYSFPFCHTQAHILPCPTHIINTLHTPAGKSPPPPLC